jgi:lysozyme
LGQYRLADIPADWVNVRAAPASSAADLGDLRVGDVVTLFAPVVNGWQQVEKPSLKGWVSLQNGAVVFEPVQAPVPSPYLNGVDVSQAQLAPDWNAVKAGGYTFAIIRATQGKVEKDTAFARHMDAALAAGMRVGAYHAFIASIDGAAQADFFHATVYPYLDKLSYPLAVDVELLNGQSPRAIADRLHTMCTTLEGLTGSKPMIYTAPGWWNGYVGSQWDAYFATLPLWVAHWTAAPEPILPRPWKRGTWTLWQHEVDENGIPGYARRIDVNRAKA